jgi:hypothetical protein
LKGRNSVRERRELVRNGLAAVVVAVAVAGMGAPLRVFPAVREAIHPFIRMKG